MQELMPTQLWLRPRMQSYDRYGRILFVQVSSQKLRRSASVVSGAIRFRVARAASGAERTFAKSNFWCDLPGLRSIRGPVDGAISTWRCPKVVSFQPPTRSDCRFMGANRAAHSESNCWNC